MMSLIRLLLMLVVIFITMEPVAHAMERNDVSDQAFSGVTWFEQRALQNAIKEANRSRNQLYFAFADESSSCDSKMTQDFSFLTFRLSHDGMKVSENGRRLRYRWNAPMLSDDHTFSTEFMVKGCSMRLSLARLGKIVNNWEFQSAKPNEYTDVQQDGADTNPGGQSLTFLFDSTSERFCPIASGSAYIFPNALISDFGHSFDHLIEHVGGSEMVDTFTIGNTDCRYVMAISHEIHTTQGTTQQRVLDLSFGEYK